MEKQKPKRILRSVVRWIVWVLIVQFILINISASFYAYRLTHVNDDPSLRNPTQSKNIFSKTWRLFSGPRQPKSIITAVPTFPFDSVTLETQKGIFIDAWYGKTDSASKGTVILFHGITASKGMVISEAADFRYQGYNVMMVDFRAHGNSGGNTTTMGIMESEEVKLTYDYIIQQGEKNIFLWGTSMGAVAIIKALAGYQLQPSGIIIEMPFASMQSHLKARSRALGFPEQPFGFLVTCWISMERGVNGFKHQTASYAKKVNCPVLMQWGALDNYVQKKETDKVYDGIASSNKKLVVYDHAGHESLLQKDPLKWRMEVERFLETNSRQAIH
jgi:alpha-beta hydrolase superfamily lysophospholipase